MALLARGRRKRTIQLPWPTAPRPPTPRPRQPQLPRTSSAMLSRPPSFHIRRTDATTSSADDRYLPFALAARRRGNRDAGARDELGAHLGSGRAFALTNGLQQR